MRDVEWADLCEFAADGAFGFEARFGRVLLVFVRTETAGATELLERLAGVNLRHNGPLHVCDVSETQTAKENFIGYLRRPKSLWCLVCISV